MNPITEQPLFLSIILPGHNEENRLPDALEQIFAFLERQAYSAEVLVVENGSSDRTLAIARRYAQRYPHCIVLREREAGKGLAVRRGMLAAHGQFRFMCDVDLSMPIAEVNKFLPPECTDFDVAIGSRELPASVRYDEPPYRHWGGRAINWLIQLLALPGMSDTQCGFKCFRAAVAEDLFRHQTLTNFSFDIELLYIARMRGYRIVEIPINWHFNPETKVEPVRDALKMILDIFKIHRNARRGLYDSSP